MKVKFVHKQGPLAIPGWSAPAKGVTFAYIEAEGMIYSSFAIASNREKEWCKWKGRLISEGRLQIAFGNRQDDVGSRAKLDKHIVSVRRDPNKTVAEQLLGSL